MDLPKTLPTGPVARSTGRSDLRRYLAGPPKPMGNAGRFPPMGTTKSTTCLVARPVLDEWKVEKTGQSFRGRRLGLRALKQRTASGMWAAAPGPDLLDDPRERGGSAECRRRLEDPDLCASSKWWLWPGPLAISDRGNGTRLGRYRPGSRRSQATSRTKESSWQETGGA